MRKGRNSSDIQKRNCNLKDQSDTATHLGIDTINIDQSHNPLICSQWGICLFCLFLQKGGLMLLSLLYDQRQWPGGATTRKYRSTANTHLGIDNTDVSQSTNVLDTLSPAYQNCNCSCVQCTALRGAPPSGQRKRKRGAAWKPPRRCYTAGATPPLLYAGS